MFQCDLKHQTSIFLEQSKLERGMWGKAIVCGRSRPKSLEVPLNGSSLYLMRFEHLQDSFVLMHRLKRKELSLQRSPNKAKKSKAPYSGSITRPLTWGPNGKKFIVAFSLFRKTVQDEMPFNSTLADMTNNNINMDNKFSFYDSMIEADNGKDKSPASSVASVDSDVKLKEDQAAVSLKSTPSVESLGFEFAQQMSHHAPPHEQDSEVLEEVLNTIVNKVVREEASRKVKAVFVANEERLKQEIESKHDASIVKSLLQRLVNTVTEQCRLSDAQTACTYSEKRVFDAVENLPDQADRQSNHKRAIVSRSHSHQSENSSVTWNDSDLKPTRFGSDSALDKASSCSGQRETLSAAANPSIDSGELIKCKEMPYSLPDNSNVTDIFADQSNDFYQIQEPQTSNHSDNGDGKSKSDIGETTTEVDDFNEVDRSFNLKDLCTANMKFTSFEEENTSQYIDSLARHCAVKDCVQQLVNDVETNLSSSFSCDSNTNNNDSILIGNTDDIFTDNLEQDFDVPGVDETGCTPSFQSDKDVRDDVHDVPTSSSRLEEDFIGSAGDEMSWETLKNAPSCTVKGNVTKHTCDDITDGQCDVTVTEESVGCSDENEAAEKSDDDARFESPPVESDVDGTRHSIARCFPQLDSCSGEIVPRCNAPHTPSLQDARDSVTVTKPASLSPIVDDVSQGGVSEHCLHLSIDDTFSSVRANSDDNTTQSIALIDGSNMTTFEPVSEYRNDSPSTVVDDNKLQLHGFKSDRKSSLAPSKSPHHPIDTNAAHPPPLLPSSCPQTHEHPYDSQKIDDTPRRPTTLFGILKHLPSCKLTPRDKNPDVYSEATEKVLEEDRSLSRQESFTKPLRIRPTVRIRNTVKFDEAEEDLKENDDEDSRVEEDPVSDSELIFSSSLLQPPASGPTCQCFEKKPLLPYSKRSRSLPFNMRTDYCDIIKFSPVKPVELHFDDACHLDVKSSTPTAAIPHYLSSFLENEEDRNRRDSALSRGSAASSGTVVASDDDDWDAGAETKDHGGHPPRFSKCSPTGPSPLTLSDVTDAAIKKRNFHIERTQSLDRTKRNSYRLSQYHNQAPAIHQPNCGMMLSAPTITVTHDCNNGYRRNAMYFDTSSTQSLASTTSYMGDESDALRSSSIGSSPLSSPTRTPNYLRKQPRNRQKSKILTLRNNKQTERQAAEACEWLKAAGFPQYVQLYEDGNFPVDIASASSDHDFLGQEHIAALVRRLNILNKCANLKLDKSTSKELQAAIDDDDLEQYALSDFWKFEQNDHRWSRLDSKASSVGSPTTKLSSSGPKQMEEDNGDVFGHEDVPRSIPVDNRPSQRRLSHDPEQNEDDLHPTKQSNLKPKSQSFLKRVGGDLKKFGSFKRKDSHRPVILPISFEDDNPKSESRVRHKNVRKNRKVEIGEPILQGGYDRIDQLKCTPIDNSMGGVRDLQHQHRGRKPSSHSLMSSSSSSGGASTASTPASRRTRASTEDFSSDFGDLSPGHYSRHRMLLDLHQSNNLHPRTKDQNQEKDSSLFVMPAGHKPGTFPAALRERGEESASVAPSPSLSSSRSHSISEPIPENHRKSSRPMSVYDNLPETAISGNASAQDFMNILDPGSPLGQIDDSSIYMGSMDSIDATAPGIDPAFWSVDDIVDHAQNLQQMVGSWDDGDEESENKSDTLELNRTETSAFPLPSDSLPSLTNDNTSNTEDDSDSISRSSADQRSQLLLRWEPLKREDSVSSPNSDVYQLHNLSAGQLMMLRRLSMLKLTARMEQYTLSNNKGALSWSVPRFIRRIKVPDYKDKTVFGVPLLQNVQRFGQPLPVCIQHALAYLRRSAIDQVGLFRKPGVRGRIQKLRELCDLHPEMEVFEDSTDYDIADLIKQYFRELPDPLMTIKMSDTFVGIFQHVPEKLQLQTLQAAIMLLPDENREALKTLLHFLSDVAANDEENQMNASNLSTCFAPSLFYQQIANLRLITSTTPRSKKHQGRPDLKAMNENKASNECLAFMITHVKDLFKISEDAATQCRMSVMQQTEDVLTSEIGYKSDYHDPKEYYVDFHSYVERTIRETFREEQRFNQNRNWQNVPTSTGCELAYKKVNDGNPLRLWRCKVEVNDADPTQIMERILNERHLWDDDLITWKFHPQPDERTQLFQMVRAEMSPHPSRDYCVLRSWRHNISPRGISAAVEVSTGQQVLLGDVRGVILTSRYVIEPTDTPNKCVLKHMCRVDTKGRNPEWYNKAYGHIVAQHLMKVRDSLRTVPPKPSSTTS